MTVSILLFRIKRYVLYWLYAVDEHSLQAPFVYDLYHQVFKKRSKLNYDVLELWKESKRDSTIISSQSGAGSVVNKKSYRVDRIAKYGVTSKTNAQLISGLIDYLKSKHVLELGTSIGINSCFMAQSSSVERLVTVELNQDLAKIAQDNFTKIGLSNVVLERQDLLDYLRQAMNQGMKFDLVYVDANHTYEATLTYSQLIDELISQETGVVVYDDINWSTGMRRAWEEISSSFSKGVVLETYQMGILIYQRGLQNQHHLVSY